MVTKRHAILALALLVPLAATAAAAGPGRFDDASAAPANGVRLAASVWVGPDGLLVAGADSDSVSAAPTSSDSLRAAPPASDSLAALPDSGGASASPRAGVAPPGRSEGRPHTALARLGRAITNFGEDCWVVASSPARLTPRAAAELALVLGAEAAFYANDQAIMDAAQRNRDDPTLHAVHKFGDLLEDAGFMPHTLEAEGGVWVLGAAFHSAETRAIAEELIESHLIGGGIRNVLKVVVGRAHPFEGRGPRVFEFGKGTSFPSGHTSIYFEAATVLSHHAHSTPVSVLLYAAASAGAIQRVQARAHWASDVFLPIFSGTLIGRTVVRLHEQRTARWSPVVEVGPRGTRVGVGRQF